MKRRNNTAAENAVRAKAPCTLDREARDLLTRAAKAAGIKIVEWVGDQANVEMDGGHYGWNPLAEWGKGEALALAVKLRLGLIPLEGGGWDVERFDERGIGRTLASCANSGAWALQEAIVHAAAALVPSGVALPDALSREDVQFLIDTAAQDYVPTFTRQVLVQIARKLAPGVRASDGSTNGTHTPPNSGKDGR